ncbi:MAG TPA: ABC transporter permease [Pilimelia sp.]|nr:ABC transporter permease [Pilimelia sp.]
MAYDEPAFRRRGADGPEPAARGARDDTTADLAGPPRRVSPAVLDDVFDDPEHGEPGRDRMAVHAVWEVVLLLAVAAVALLLYRAEPAALRGAALNSLLVYVSGLLLLALGVGLSLRVGAVNLAAGPVAVASALHFAEQGDRGVLVAGGTAALAAAAFGLVLAVVVVGLQVPGWAGSVAAILVVAVFVQRRTEPVAVQGGYEPTEHSVYVFGVAAGLTLIGGLLGTVKSVRRTVGRFRPVADPARRRGALAGVLTAGGITLSMVFAAGAGVLFAAGGTGPVAPGTGLDLTGLALGAALLGGTSAFGRRGGVFGTLLAVVLTGLFITYNGVQQWRISLLLIAATAILGGLVVTRLVERYGRPRSAGDNDRDWSGAGADPGADGWSTGGRTESWSSALPAESAGTRTASWEGDSWGGPAR